MNNTYGALPNVRRCQSSSANQVQYDPFMFGGSRGFCVGSGPYRQQPVAQTTMSTSQGYMPAVRTSSLNNYNQTQSVQECMHWSAPMSRTRNSGNSQMNSYRMDPRSSREAANPGVAGDFQYCQAPPKVYLQAPGIDKGVMPQNIQCQVAPLGTDPMSLIKPVAPLTVRVQAPADLFTGNSTEPRTIAISPAQLYGTGGRK